MSEHRRCVLLFSRSPREEGLAKRLSDLTPLFDLSRRRVDRAVASLPGVDLREPVQRGGTFGERLLNAFSDTRALGYREIVAVPTDAPDLGPSPDGGVYLLGLAAQADLERLLLGVRWRTALVTRDLIANEPSACLLESALPDIDRRADLATLKDRNSVSVHAH